MTTLSDEAKFRFVEIVMGVYEQFFLPLIHPPDTAGERRNLMEQAVEGDLLEGVAQPITLANSFRVHIANLHKNKRLSIMQPFSLHVANHVSKHVSRYDARPQHDPVVTTAEPTAMDTPLNELPQPARAGKLVELFQGLVGQGNAPRNDHQMLAVASRYVEVLGHMTTRQISQRINLIVAHSNFFPKPSEILSTEPVQKARERTDEVPPLSDPDCRCDHGWVTMPTGVEHYKKAHTCDRCDLGKWHASQDY